VGDDSPPAPLGLNFFMDGLGGAFGIFRAEAIFLEGVITAVHLHGAQSHHAPVNEQANVPSTKGFAAVPAQLGSGLGDT
jgi:hypothetical protein